MKGLTIMLLVASVLSIAPAVQSQDNGKVLIAGGDDQSYWSPDTILSSAELYDPDPPIPVPRIIGASVSGKKLIVVGENFV